MQNAVNISQIYVPSAPLPPSVPLLLFMHARHSRHPVGGGGGALLNGAAAFVFHESLHPTDFVWVKIMTSNIRPRCCRRRRPRAKNWQTCQLPNRPRNERERPRLVCPSFRQVLCKPPQSPGHCHLAPLLSILQILEGHLHEPVHRVALSHFQYIFKGFFLMSCYYSVNHSFSRF